MPNDDQQDEQVSQEQHAGGDITHSPQMVGDQNTVNTASNYGAQGTFHGPVHTGPVYHQQSQHVHREQYNIGGDAHFDTASQRHPLHQLRAPIGDFIGREQEIAQLTAVLCSGQGADICGVRGMGGIGKTELAYVVAHMLCGAFPDAQLVVELFGATSPLTPERALQAVIRAFEPQAKLPDDLPALKQRYAACLHGKRALILADDAYDAAQVRPLLPPVGCALLITSRPHIELDGMYTHTLGTLARGAVPSVHEATTPAVHEETKPAVHEETKPAVHE